MSATIAINKVHFPVTTLGYGRRVGLWTQGCSIHCPGCISRDTWNFDANKAISIAALMESLSVWLPQADGVTISGGEPFDQPAALKNLLTQIRLRHAGDILVFSGYPQSELAAKHQEIFAWIDVLISEPYQADSGNERIWRGSDNQRITLLSDLARQRYPADIDQQTWNGPRSLDVFVEGESVWMAGIPRPGELARLQEKLAAAGYACHASDEPNRMRA